MTKENIREVVASCIHERKPVRVLFRYNKYFRYYLPFDSNDKLFFGAEESDFCLDGYTVRRYRDAVKSEFRADMCVLILKQEGFFDNIAIPAVDITDWEAVFRSLQGMGQNVIIERDDIDPDESDFYIGRIEKVYKHFLYFRHFDADGIWQDEPCKIPYAEITSVTFGSRYVEIFSKYLGPLPENFTK